MRRVTYIVGHDSRNIIFTFRNDGIHPFCGGVLLSSDTVLTAAHCSLSAVNGPLGIGIIPDLNFQVK